MTTNAGFCAKRGRVGAGECTRLYRILHNSITYYTSCISCVKVGRVGQVDIAATQQLLVSGRPISRILQETPQLSNVLLLNVAGINVLGQLGIELLCTRNECKKRAVKSQLPAICVGDAVELESLL